MSAAGRRALAFPSCGGRAAVLVEGSPDADAAVDAVRHDLAAWERRLTRFDPGSELSRLNAGGAERTRVSDLLCRFASAAVEAAVLTNGLVDPTLLEQIAGAGYGSGLGAPLPLALSLRLAPPRRPAGPDTDAGWRRITVDCERRIVSRPPGVGLDSGGIAKGLFADLAGASLAAADSWAVDVCGDLSIGGRAGTPRPVRVDDPFGRGVLHEFEIAAGGVATSGISRRSWLGPDGRVAHHLLDPATGRPAFTGIVQATALAPSALEAERLAKAALLEGPAGARRWLPHGGVLVFDDGSHDVVAQPAAIAEAVAA
ncbi:MAG: FAD:protein transferase [Thermoleophilaceae bacterium]|nr:FAD:protein transferase [Thermoleophilaceae bacterium]